MKAILKTLAVALPVLSGCSLEAPPPTGAPQSTSVGPSSQTSTDTSVSDEQTVGLAPAPSDVSEEVAVSPGSPVNFVALTPVPMALIWYGRTDLDDVPVTVSKAGTASRITFKLRNLAIDCEGLIRFDGSQGFGDWELFCSDASEAAGILVPVVGQKAINGQGVDQSNRSVIFSIPLRN